MLGEETERRLSMLWVIEADMERGTNRHPKPVTAPLEQPVTPQRGEALLPIAFGGRCRRFWKLSSLRYQDC